MKILTFIGTRPEAIKMAPLIKLIDKNPLFHGVICSTGQHKEMLYQVFNLFSIKPDYELSLMSDNQTLFSLSSKLLQSIEGVIDSEKPDLVLVHGDTSTAMISSLASFYKQIPVCHIEAGLRTHSKYNPFPEEMNRQIISKIAEYHFAPTNLNKDNLINENINASNIYVTGNTVIDAIQIISKAIDNEKETRELIIKSLMLELGFDPNESKFVLITGHRRENFGEGIKKICESLVEIANKYPDIKFIYPVHLNPNIQEPVQSILNNQENIKLIKPVSYDKFCYLLKECFFVLTDSGGIQEEAPGLGKPVLLMRENSERPEAIDAGTVIIVGTDPLKIKNECLRLIEDKLYYDSIATIENPYGSGNSSNQIIKILERDVRKKMLKK